MIYNEDFVINYLKNIVKNKIRKIIMKLKIK